MRKTGRNAEKIVRPGREAPRLIFGLRRPWPMRPCGMSCRPNYSTRRRLRCPGAGWSPSSNSFAHIMFCVRETAAEQ